MRHVKRSRCLFFYFDEEELFDLEAFLRGKIHVSPKTVLIVACPLTAERIQLSNQQLLALASVSRDTWVPTSLLIERGLVDQALLDEWVARGLLLSDGEDDHATRLRRRDELLSSQQWNDDAAFYHFMTTRSAAGASHLDGFADLEGLPSRSRQLVGEFISKHGVPPSPFHHREDAEDGIQLPLIDQKGDLFKTLTSRRTTRLFDRSKKLERDDFSTLLRYTFGVHSQTDLGEGLVVLGKTSPSGGSLHPIEAYPLVLRVEGVDPGFYHYVTERHSLERLAACSVEEAEDFATRAMKGQAYAASAQVLFIMASRFFRNFWKYRRVARTYSVILMDAGHLSQTFYLVATKLGLGAFFSAAIDNPEVDHKLALEPAEEGSLAICGCGGLRPPGEERLELERQPFRPRGGG